MSSISVKSIVKETENQTLTVKVLRLWFPLDAQKKPVAMELILMDHEVNIFSYFLIILNMYIHLCHTDNSLI